jgi:hypothetical protein
MNITENGNIAAAQTLIPNTSLAGSQFEDPMKALVKSKANLKIFLARSDTLFNKLPPL